MAYHTLTIEQIRTIIDAISREVVAEFDGFTVTKPSSGYSKDPKVLSIQNKLSIMLATAPE